MKRLAFVCVTLMVVGGVLSPAVAAVVPDEFQLRLVATDLQQPKGLDAALYRTGIGKVGHDLIIAESGADRIVIIKPDDGTVTPLAQTLGQFPVGVACWGGGFGKNMYVGNAMGGGIVKIDEAGTPTQFALPAFDIAGMDFGNGLYGHHLYVGEWQTGNIWKVDRDGNANLFATLPNCETRYMEFSHGGEFGHYLYVTDYVSGDIFKVKPDGTYDVFASTASPCLEGLAFGPGGDFGKDLYAGDVCTGDLYRVEGDGTVNIFAFGFDGVADIIFKPTRRAGFSMFLVDGHTSVYEIRPIK